MDMIKNENGHNEEAYDVSQEEQERLEEQKRLEEEEWHRHYEETARMKAIMDYNTLMEESYDRGMIDGMAEIMNETEKKIMENMLEKRLKARQIHEIFFGDDIETIEDMIRKMDEYGLSKREIIEIFDTSEHKEIEMVNVSVTVPKELASLLNSKDKSDVFERNAMLIYPRVKKMIISYKKSRRTSRCQQGGTD